METIEEIILDHDKRGISLLREHLPTNFCGQAAEILSQTGGVTRSDMPTYDTHGILPLQHRLHTVYHI